MTSYQDLEVQEDDRVLNVNEVIKKTSLGRTTIYRQMKAGTFPKQVSLGGQRVGWLESDIKRWLEKIRHSHVSV